MYAGCHCPHCESSILTPGRQDQLSVAVCRDCAGAFATAHQGLRLLAAAGADPQGGASRAGEVGCPVCRQAMRVVPVESARVEVDVCMAHGIWFDAEELVALSRAVPSPAGRPARRLPDALAEHVGSTNPGHQRRGKKKNEDQGGGVVADVAEGAVEVGVDSVVDGADVIEGIFDVITSILE